MTRFGAGSGAIQVRLDTPIRLPLGDTIAVVGIKSRYSHAMPYHRKNNMLQAAGDCAVYLGSC